MSEIKNYDRSFCGNLPLHLTNLIQPHGALLVVTREDLTVVQVSENIKDFTGLSADGILRRHLSVLFAGTDVDRLVAEIEAGSALRIPMSFTINGPGASQLLGLIHAKPDHLIIELEKREENKANAFFDFYRQIRYLMSSIESATSKEQICAIALKELSALSEFDRIMIYQFDRDWNGTVVAEQINKQGLDPYLGLKFPASDVPKPARELYYKNPYRLIPDRNYVPSRLYPVLNPISGGFTNLSDCNLRSVAGVHIEYLENMGVTASMSTRIILDDRLWGLISCHHSGPKYLDFEMCSIFELLSNIFSARLTSISAKEDFMLRSKKQDLLLQLRKQVDNANHLIDGLLQNDLNAAHLLNADGLAIYYNNQVYTLGVTPSRTALNDLLFWLQANDTREILAIQNLAEQLDGWAENSEIVSGLLAIPFSAAGYNNYILAFRRELIQTVDWGGNPNEALQFEADQKNYHPRSSFSQWKELLKNTSKPWETYILDIAGKLKSMTLEYTVSMIN